MIYYIYLAVIFFLFGIVIGSFLNVCIYRIPLNQTIVTVPSHCTHCNHKLAWYDLFPLFSWLSLGGKCRYCKGKISAQYPIIEFLNGVLYLTVFLLSPANANIDIIVLICRCMFLSTLLVLAVIDIQHQIVPDRINIFIIFLSIPILIIDRANWLSHLIGMFSVSVPLLALALVTNGFGGGDIKLYAVCGLFLGWKLTLLSIIITSIIAAVYGVSMIAIKKPKDGGKTKLPLVPFISTSMFICIFWGDTLINWYISQFFVL